MRTEADLVAKDSVTPSAEPVTLAAQSYSASPLDFEGLGKTVIWLTLIIGEIVSYASQVMIETRIIVMLRHAPLLILLSVSIVIGIAAHREYSSPAFWKDGCEDIDWTVIWRKNLTKSINQSRPPDYIEGMTVDDYISNCCSINFIENRPRPWWMPPSMYDPPGFWTTRTERYAKNGAHHDVVTISTYSHCGVLLDTKRAAE